MEGFVLFQDKKDCCGCGTCAEICPKHAISLSADSEGFFYPQTDANLCVQCGLCKKRCNFQNDSKLNIPEKVYAAASLNEDTIIKSSSGGIFMSIAEEILETGGVVFGCAWDHLNGELVPRHIKAENRSELERLQGSKYVQSSLKGTFSQIKGELDGGKKVLFSGTPCQVDALYGFLGNKKHDNLFTVDIICHGVPGYPFFRDYIDNLQNHLHGKIVNVSFRDKEKGWGLKGCIYYKDHKGNLRKKNMPLQGFAYYKMFLDSDIYRENCYSCKYASINRIGDITLGDYWGVEKEHPDYISENGGPLDLHKGISCLLVNNERGKILLHGIQHKAVMLPSTIDQVKRNNGQLNHPSSKGRNHDRIMSMYKSADFKTIEKWYYKQFGLKGLLYRIWNRLPGKIEGKK